MKRSEGRDREMLDTPRTARSKEITWGAHDYHFSVEEHPFHQCDTLKLYNHGARAQYTTNDPAMGYVLLLLILANALWTIANPSRTKTCTVRPLGHGRDDTDQVEAAIARCGHFGSTILEAGEYNITRYSMLAMPVDVDDVY